MLQDSENEPVDDGRESVWPPAADVEHIIWPSAANAEHIIWLELDGRGTRLPGINGFPGVLPVVEDLERALQELRLIGDRGPVDTRCQPGGGVGDG